MLKYHRSVPYLPELARSRARITDRQRALAAAEPPHPVPFHCKPWLDGQTVGWTLCYGFLSDIVISGREDGGIGVENLAELARETQQPRIVAQFAEGHFGLGTGYTLSTPEGLVSLILPATEPPAYLESVVGVVESDWYPRQLFLVFHVPAPGQRVHLTRGTPLARVVVIPRHDGLTARPLEGDELEQLLAREQAYLEEEASTDSRWTAATGDSFTHLYRQWSSRNRRPQPE